MTRKTVNVNPAVKVRLEELKKHTGLSSESEVIAYLAQFYTDHFHLLTVKNQQSMVSKVKDMHNQGVIV